MQRPPPKRHGSYGRSVLLGCDEADRCGFVKAANHEGKIACAADLNCLALDEIAALVGEGQRSIERKTWQMACLGLAMRIAREVAGNIFEQLAADALRALGE